MEGGKPPSKDFFKPANKDIMKTYCWKLMVDKFKLEIKHGFLASGSHSPLRNIAKDIGVCVFRSRVS